MSNRSSQSDNVQTVEERLAQVFYSNGRYNALILAVTAIGFIVIYVLTYFNILGEPAPQLLFISGAVFVLGLLQVLAVNLARRNRGVAAHFAGALSVIIFAILLTAFWEGMALLALVVSLITPISAMYAGMPRRYYGWLAVLVLGGMIGISFANSNPFIERLQFDAPAAVASLSFLGTIGLLLVTVTYIARSRRYRSLRNQLLISFTIIVTIPTLLAASLSAVGAYVNNETQVFNTLKTITTLKESQIGQVLDNLQSDAVRINQDEVFRQNILNLLTAQNGTSPLTLENYQTASRNRLINVIGVEQSTYAEIMVLNVRGEVVLSTDPVREGRNYQAELFHRQGSIRAFTGFSRNPAFGNFNLIHSTPIYDTDGSILRGTLVIRANSTLIRNIVENTPGFEEMETYLIRKETEMTTTGERETLSPLTSTRSTPPTFNTPDLQRLLAGNVREGSSMYGNYAGQPTLGYFKYLPGLDVYIIAEVPRAFIISSSINSLLGSSALAVFAIVIAVVAVMISAESIATPISALAKAAEDFAAGNLSARANIERRDEIGSLGNAYDQMAGQLQNIIGRLEQRVVERTQALEEQSLRLRTSAEIARDAASLHNLDDLLNRAGILILERFGFYHTGIFLLDKNLEYAVLTASPTEAGRQMIANNHRLRIGEVGIVGRVALTGEPRIALDTGADSAFFNNPYLPNTRSEMALPLKVENRIIGVLDVQSDKPQAFNDDDIAIMQILADQLATAIERTRLLQQVEQNLADLERAYGQFTSASWKSLSESGLLSQTGYRFDNVRIQPISLMPELGDEAIRSGARIMSANGSQTSEKNQVAIPIKLRGQTIGVVAATLKDGYTSNTISTLELAIERLALSLESARLYEEARLRADREQMIAQVTTSISSATEFDTILRTTVEEIGKLLGDTEVAIQIASDVDGNQPE